MSPPLQRSASGSVTTEIVRTVAAQEGVDPTELGQPLYEVIDTDALNALLSSTKSGPRNGRVTFTYCGRTVTVSGGEPPEIEIAGGPHVEGRG